MTHFPRAGLDGHLPAAEPAVGSGRAHGGFLAPTLVGFVAAMARSTAWS
jgi:hypothetical protein